MSGKKILVALEPQATLVWEQALQLAQLNSSTLLLVHVINWDKEGASRIGLGTLRDIDVTGATLKDRRDRLEQRITQAEDWLDTYRQQAVAQTIPTELRCVAGDPGHEICGLAHSWGAELIIVGRHHRTGLAEMVLGSVSNYVVHHAPCSVLVVQ